MRWILTLAMFFMVGSTLTGSLVIGLLAGAVPGANVRELMPLVAAGGFLVSIPISYILAGVILKKTSGQAPREA